MLLFPLTKPDGEVTGLIIYDLNNINSSTGPSNLYSKSANQTDNKSSGNNSSNSNLVDVIPRSLNVPIGLFGWSVVPPETTEIILCADVFDVMLLSQTRPANIALCFPRGKVIHNRRIVGLCHKRLIPTRHSGLNSYEIDAFIS